MQQGAFVAPQQFKINESQQGKLFSTKPIQRPFIAPISSATSEELTMSACPTPTQNILSSVGYNGLSQTAISNNAFNSLNIRRLVQQSNNYWQAERTFFSSEKKHPGGNEELDKLERSILNVVNDGGSYNSFSYSGEGGVVPLSPIPQPTQSSKSPFTGRHQTTDGTSTAVTGGGTAATTTTTYFSQSRRLQEISFSFSLVKKGATELGKYSLSMNSDCLQIVDLSYNKFRDVPQEILSLKQLRVLKMDTNLIKVLNPEIFSSLKLEYFSIANNLLFEVPELIVLWKDTLKYLDISLNRIEDLSILSELQLLQSLHIQNNDFRYLPTSLHLLMNSQFKELTLDWFQYTQPPLELQQSGQLGMKVIQRLKIILQTQFEQNIQSVSFMDTILKLSGSPSNFDILRVDKKDHNRSLSHLAAVREEIGCLVSLLENKYSLINSLDSEGHTPLSLSILHEKFFSAKTLISNGADVNLGGALFGNCLNLATIKYQYYLVLDLLKRGANPNAQDAEGNTPLHYIMTIFHRDIDYSSKICDLLLQFHADPNILNKDLWAPIHLLSRRGTVEAFKFIQDYNKYLYDNNYKNKRLEDKIPNFSGNYAIRMPSTSFQPFSINIVGGKERQTPLHIACWHSCYNLANLLLSSGADIFARDAANRIPLHLCMRDNFLYKLLKQKEAVIFNKEFSTKREMTEDYGEDKNQFTNQTPLKTIFTNQSFISVSPNRTNYSQPFSQRNQTNASQNCKNTSEKNRENLKCSNKPVTKNQSQENDQGSKSASRPCFSQHQLKGSDSIINLDDWDDSSNINNAAQNDPSEIGQENNRKLSQIKDSLVNSKASGRLSERKREELDDEVHESSSKLTEIAVMPGMSVKGNSKNQNCRDEEKEQTMQPCQGQLCRNSLLLSKQQTKQGEDEKESLNFDDEKDFDPSNFQDLDEKEEEFLNSEIDEAKSMLELFNTKQKIINQSLAYAPNNIQQLNYIQAINRANLKKTKNSQPTQQHLRSRSEIPSGNKIFQKSISDSQSTAVTNNKPKGLIRNDGIDVPLQIVTPQHISFFQYLLEKTKNMYDYYSVSLHNYKKGILSEFNTLYEKYRYFIIILKLQFEFQNMIFHLLEEKKQLSSLLGGDFPFLQLGAIDQKTTNIMVMKIILEIVMNLKCENYQQLLIKVDYPAPSFHTFLFSSQIPNSNMTFWMRQYEESFMELNPMKTSDQDKLENFDGNSNQKTQTDNPQLFQEVNLNERENSLIKENIIYQLGNFHFVEALDYLEGEIKSPNISTLNAFEACQSFFKIKDNLISQPQTVNTNQIIRNKVSLPSKPVSDCDINESIQSALSPSFAKETFLKSASIRSAVASSQPKQALTQRQRHNSGVMETQRTSTDERCPVNSTNNQINQAQNILKLRKDSLSQQQQSQQQQQQLQLITDKPPIFQKRGSLQAEISNNNQPTNRQGLILPQNKPPISPISVPQSKIFPEQLRKKGSSLGMASSDDDDSFNLIVPSDFQFPSDSQLTNSQLNSQLLPLGHNFKQNQQGKQSYLIPISQFSSSLTNRNSKPFS